MAPPDTDDDARASAKARSLTRDVRRPGFEWSSLVGGIAVGMVLHVLVQPALVVFWPFPIQYRNLACFAAWEWMGVTQLAYLAPLAALMYRRKCGEFVAGIGFVALVTVYVSLGRLELP